MRPERSAGARSGRACGHASVWDIIRGVRERVKNGSDMQLRKPEPCCVEDGLEEATWRWGPAWIQEQGRWRGDGLRAIQRQGPELGPDGCFLPPLLYPPEFVRMMSR